MRDEEPAKGSRNDEMNQFRLSVVRQETSEFYKLSNLTPDGKASHSYKDSQAIEESINGRTLSRNRSGLEE